MKDTPGFVRLSRKIFEHSFWKEKRAFSKFEAWVDLISLVSFDEKEKTQVIGNKIVKWGRGQYPASIRYLQERWQWGSTKRVKYFLDLLEKENMISIERETGQNVVTICKYDVYNALNSEGKREGNAEETEGKQKGNKTKKGKKEEEIKEDNTLDLFTDVPPEFIEKWYKFKAWFSEEKFPRVKKMEKQLTAKQLYQLTEDYTVAEINATLEGMENYKKLGNYTSVYLTLNNWIKREQAKTA